MLNSFKHWRGRVHGIIEDAIGALIGCAASLFGVALPCLVDYKAWHKSYDEAAAQGLLDFPNRSALVQAIKDMNICLKKMDTMVSASSGTGLEVEPLKKGMKGLAKVRNQSRGQVTFRTAAVILQNKSGMQVEKFYQSAKLNRVSIPAGLKTKLDALD